MFGLIKKRDLAAFAERVHNDNTLDARVMAPMRPIGVEEHKKAAYWRGYIDGTHEFFLAIRALLFGGKKKRRNGRRSKPLPYEDGRSGNIPCRKFETIVTVRIHEISKNVELPVDFDVNKYKRGVEGRIRRVLRDADCDGDNVNVKVQVFMKDEGEAGR